MYLGLVESTCSGKNQIYFPTKFKKIAGEDLFMTNWFEFCIIILPFTDAKNVVKILSDEAVSLLSEGRKLQRYLYSGAERVMVNSEGRFTIPAHLKEYGMIQRDVIFRGVGNRIELWSKESYERYGFLTDESARQTAIDLFNKIKK